MSAIRDSKSSTIGINSWLSNIVLLIAVIFICFIAGELLIRFFFADSIVLFPRYHTEAHYGDYTLRRLRPNTTFWHTSPDGQWQFATNAQGFRDRDDYDYDKPPGVLRVISLGDSQTQGYEVRQERTYSEILERFLQAGGRQVEVLNTGISGFSTAEQLAFLENEGIRYQPDVVIVGFYANDFDDNVKAGLFALEGDRLVVKKKQHTPGVGIQNVMNSLPLIGWLSQNSYLYSLAMNTVWNTAKMLLLKQSEAELRTEFAVPTGQLTQYKKALATRLIERMYDFCRSHGIRLVLLDIPQLPDSRADAFQSSVPPDLEAAFRNHSDAFISSEEVLGDYRHIAEIYVPHGHNHINEFAHLMLGLAAARVISTLVPPDQVS